MTPPSNKPWYEKQAVIGTLLVLTLLVVLMVWLLGVGATFTATP